ncbi:hypothetical protein FA15DRAFT_576091, partial [Coprinopsis marcescibilis]
PELEPYLRNNDPPDEDLVILAREEMMKEEQQIDYLEREIARHQQQTVHFLQEWISSLQWLSSKFKDKRDGYRSIISPLRRFPPELITEIVKISLSPDGMLDHEGRLSFMHFRGVNRTWRNVMFTSKTLWSGLTVEV